MTPSVFTLVVLSAALHATWNLLIKRSSDKLLMTVSVTVSAGLAGLVSLPFFSKPAEASWVFIAASAFMSVAYFLMIAATYKIADLSLAYPVIRGSAPLIVGLAGMLFLAEYLPLTAWAAILVISAGILSMALAKHEHGLRGLLFALATAALTAACTLIDAEGARRSQSPAAYTLCIFAGTGLLMAIWAAHTRRGEFWTFYKKNWRTSFPAGVGALCSYGTALWAMTLAPVAIVAALRETTVLFGAALAWLVLGEQIGRSRLTAIVLIAIGVACVRAT